MDVTAPRRPDASSSSRLWFAFLGGMAAYALHLLIGFWIVPAACGSGAEPLLPWIELVVTLVLGAVAVLATVVAVALRRDIARSRSAPHRPVDRAGVPAAWDVAPASSTAQFMATTGIVLSAISVVVILFAAAPLVLVSPCA